jgi:hypothetical protein
VKGYIYPAPRRLGWRRQRRAGPKGPASVSPQRRPCTHAAGGPGRHYCSLSPKLGPLGWRQAGLKQKGWTQPPPKWKVELQQRQAGARRSATNCHRQPQRSRHKQPGKGAQLAVKRGGKGTKQRGGRGNLPVAVVPGGDSRKSRRSLPKGVYADLEKVRGISAEPHSAGSASGVPSRGLGLYHLGHV